MKKQLTAMLAFAGLSLFATSLFADTETVRKALIEKMPKAEVRSITKSAYEGLYEVVINGSNIFYTDAKGEIGFFGKVIDLRTRADLTEKRAQELMVVDFSRLPLDKAITQVKGDGSRKLAVFADPDCPYCKQLEKDLDGMTNITVHTFLLPLTSIHPDAMRKAEIIWCSADRAKSYRDWMVEGIVPTGARDCQTPIADIITLSKAYWIQGTPGMVFASGKLVPGALQRHQIEALLDAAKTAAQ
jgi:thiol:disulfide interchange protein DsbC